MVAVSLKKNEAYYSAGRNKRIYSISPIKPKFKESLYEFINKYSKIKVSEPYRTILHGEKMSPEKAMILALKSQNFRLILASLNLFKHIKNWKHLNELAKKEQLQRQIGALYDLSREIIKVRKIDKRINNSLLNGKGKKYIYSNIKTREYFNIAKKWRVEIPFNKKDIERLKIG